MSDDKKFPARIGALWAKSNDHGQFMTGTVKIDGQEYNLFIKPNGFYEQDGGEARNQPHWHVFPGKARG